jgi:hypothetical protein
MEISGWPTVGCLAIPVLTPLPYVARHIVEPQFVGLELGNRIVVSSLKV